MLTSLPVALPYAEYRCMPTVPVQHDLAQEHTPSAWTHGCWHISDAAALEVMQRRLTVAMLLQGGRQDGVAVLREDVMLQRMPHMRAQAGKSAAEVRLELRHVTSCLMAAVDGD